MTRMVKLIVGGVLVLFGVVFTLQGLDVLGGSGMSGKTLWAILGPIIVLIGLYMVFRGARRPAA